MNPSAEEIRRTWGRMGPGLHVCLDVTDTGPGLAPEARLRLFRQPFFTAKARHHGLGLSIVQRIIDEHGGIIRAENAPDGGGIVTVKLPIYPGSRIANEQ